MYTSKWISSVLTDILGYMTNLLPSEVITILRLFADVYSSRLFRPLVLARVIWLTFLEVSNR